MKRGPLSKEQKAYIASNYKKKSIASFVKKYDKSEAVITKYVEELKNPTPAPIPVAPEEKPVSKTRDTTDLFARNKKYGVTIMTENASMVSDENKATRRPSGVRYMKDCINIIKKDKK
jgi:hypothetical protein